MPDFYNKARELIQDFKGDSYLFGKSILSKVGEVAALLGKNALFVSNRNPKLQYFIKTIQNSLAQAGVELLKEIKGAQPNAPREDLFRIADQFKEENPEIIISFGGGSTIDTAKAAEVLYTLSGEIDSYFGTGLVTEALKKSGKRLSPHIAIQTASSSAAHLTKYSNITDIKTSQKKLIVDNAIVPSHPIFEHSVTYSMPAELTVDGASDGIAHILEVLYGAVNKPFYEKIVEIARIGISLIVNNLPRALDNPQDVKAREALCLATDLGGYAIMIGGTNGGHLTSFSLVDILKHGRACAVMNPYYTLFFAPAIEEPLRLIGGIYKKAGFISQDIKSLKGRDLGMAVAKGMFNFAERVGLPIRLSDIEGFSQAHIKRALTAAKNPQLKMKLENMPVPLTTEMIEDYMKPILEAAKIGDLSLIKNV